MCNVGRLDTRLLLLLELRRAVAGGLSGSGVGGGIPGGGGGPGGGPARAAAARAAHGHGFLSL